MGRLSFAAQNCTWQVKRLKTQHHTDMMIVSCEDAPQRPHATLTDDVQTECIPGQHVNMGYIDC